MAQVARKLVSQKKKRYQKDGFDLDLACKLCVSVCLCVRRTAHGVRKCEHSQHGAGRETLLMILTQRMPVRADIPNDERRIVAMGIPIPRKLVCGDTEGENHPLYKEAAFRNPMDEVVRFFDTIHPYPEGSAPRVKVFNLCIEPDRQYDVNYFKGQVNTDCQFFDHNCPPLMMIPNFCASAKEWLDADALNVCAVHCKAGKSRTGLMVCSLLLHLGQETDPTACVKNYGNARCNDGKGVTIPSQQRYIHCYKMLLDLGGYAPAPRPLRVERLVLCDHPAKAKFHYSIEQWNAGEKKMFQSWTDNSLEEQVEQKTLVEKKVFVGEWRCVAAAANVRAGFARTTRPVGEVRRGRVLEELESRRDPKDGVLRLKFKVPATATDPGFTGWVSEKTADGEELFVNAANRDVFVTEFETEIGTEEDAPPADREGVDTVVDGDFKITIYKEKVTDEGISTQGSTLGYFWLHTAFLPAADPETGKVEWKLRKEQIDKFKAKDEYLDSFTITLTLEEASERAAAAELSDAELAFRALKEERMGALRDVCRKQDDGFVTTEQKAAAAMDEASAKAEQVIAQNADLLRQSKAALAETAEMKALSGIGANQTVNAATVVSAGSQVLAAMSDKLGAGIDGSESNALAKAQQDGLKLLGSSGGDPVQAMQQNPQFVAQLKTLVVTYVQDAVMGAKIPDVANKKDWGNYEITDLAVESMEIDPANLIVTIKNDVRIDLTRVSAKFKSFNWTYNKTTFPKAKDAGIAEVNIEGLEAHVSFEMVTDKQAVMTIDHMKAKIELGQLAVSVAEAGGSAAKKWMYNKLLTIFDEKIKDGNTRCHVAPFALYHYIVGLSSVTPSAVLASACRLQWLRRRSVGLSMARSLC